METQASWRVRRVGLWLGWRREAREVRVPTIALGEGIVLITGASGSGKTTLLRELARRVGGVRAVRLERIRLGRRAVVDCFGLPLEETVGLLSRAGLAEARVWVRMPGELSEGERFRFRLAAWMAQRRRRVLIADEFCNGLDRVTARGVAWQLRRFVEGARERGERRLAVVATGHEDLVRDLRPEVHVRMGLSH